MNTTTSTLKIAVFGAAGEVGRRLVDEAARRGHTVSAVTRRRPEASAQHPAVTEFRRDVESDVDLAGFVADHDFVISALRPRAGEEHKLVDLTARVVEAARAAGRRFLVVGGAAPLLLPDSREHTVLSAPGFLPASVRPIAEASAAQHEWITSRLAGLGTYLCPPAMLAPGSRTGNYRVGHDTLVADEQGESWISMEDFAVAALNEAERPAHTGRRFTVGT